MIIPAGINENKEPIIRENERTDKIIPTYPGCLTILSGFF